MNFCCYCMNFILYEFYYCKCMAFIGATFIDNIMIHCCYFCIVWILLLSYLWILLLQLILLYFIDWCCNCCYLHLLHNELLLIAIAAFYYWLLLTILPEFCICCINRWKDIMIFFPQFFWGGFSNILRATSALLLLIGLNAHPEWYEGHSVPHVCLSCCCWPDSKGHQVWL